MSITIDSSNNTLAGIRDAINDSNAGVKASLLKNGSQYQLFLVAEKTGVANSVALSITADGDGDNADSTGLSQLSFDASTARMTQYAAGADAAFSLNGLSLSSESNTISNIIDGVTLELYSVTSTAISLSVKKDTSSIVDDVATFVESFNAYNELMAEYISYDADTGTAGTLQGDSTARSIDSQIRDRVAQQLTGTGQPYRSLSDLGISIDRFGNLSFLSSKLETALTNDPEAVEAVFADTSYQGAPIEGIAANLDSMLDTFLGSAGLLSSRTTSINGVLASIESERSELDRRMQSVEARYYKQFNAMDSMLAEIEATGNFLSQQFEAMKPRKD